MTEHIKGFQGAYRFLSNFYPCPVEFEGVAYLSSDAAYQASKTLNGELRERFTIVNAREARRLGRHIFPLREDWEDEKLNTMYRILRAKFTQNSAVKQQLLGTGAASLEETNWWYDQFWGVYNGKGENHLGKLLMLVRDELREGIIK